MDPVSYIHEVMEPLSPIPTGVEPRLAQVGEIKAVLFDIYGTLLISAAGDISLASESRSFDAMEKAIASLGPDLRDMSPDIWLDAYQKFLTKRQQIRAAEGVAFPEVEIREVWGDVISEFSSEPIGSGIIETAARMYEYGVNPCWEMPGARELISSLETGGFSLGIISNAQFYTHDLVEALLQIEMTQPCWAGDLTLFSYQEREGKPSAALYEKIRRNAAARGIKSQEILYIGNDFCKDVEPAQKAGFRAALFAGDQRSFRPGQKGIEFACQRADAVLTDLRQLELLL